MDKDYEGVAAEDKPLGGKFDVNGEACRKAGARAKMNYRKALKLKRD